MQYEPFAIERLQDILRLGLAMHGEGGYRVVPFDIEKAANSILRLVINNEDGFGMLAYTSEGKPVGMIAGSITPYFFSRGLVASDFVWFVLPEYRGSRTSLRLLDSFKNWAEERGAFQLFMGVSTNISADRTGELLGKMGFEHMGGNYRVNLDAKP
jgi:GNAT superfamily N-acetyltransferase